MAAHDPSPSQLEVIRSEATEIMVDAGAGTGKTTTMVGRYIHLLEERDFEAREILAITYTEKAAGELRERLRKERQELARRQGVAAPLAVSMSDAWVGTFHAICLRILKAWPIEAEVDPGFSVIDEVTAETVRSSSFDRSLKQLLDEAEDAEERNRIAVMIGTVGESNLRGSVAYAYDELRSRGIAKPGLPPLPEGLPDPGIDDLADLARLAEQDKTGWGPKQKATFETLKALKGRTDVKVSELAGIEFTSNGKTPLPNASRLADEIRLTVGRLAEVEFGRDYYRYFATLLDYFGEEFARQKQELSVLDYEDLQLKAVELLRSEEHSRIRETYLARFREVIVDEFQDTNQLQVDLIRLLVNRPEEDGLEDFPSTTLVTVGDEMQSIYGFRHADVKLFRDRHEQPGVTAFRLEENYRSSPSVINLVNAVGGRLRRQVESARDVQGEAAVPFPELVAGQSDDGGGSTSLFLTARSDWRDLDLGGIAPVMPPGTGRSTSQNQEAEALSLASFIRDQIDNEVVTQGEIAILLRARTAAAKYVKALEQFGLQAHLSGGKGFWGTRESLDLRALLAVIANPLDDESLLICLNSPACGVSSDTFWLIGQARPYGAPIWRSVEWAATGVGAPEQAQEYLDQISPEDLQRLTDFRAVVDQLRNGLASHSIEGLIIAAINETGYDLASLDHDPDAIPLAGIRRFQSLAREFEEAEGRDLRGFLDWIELSAGLDRESEASIAEEHSDVIRIMTVHAAKGLEFEMVCVPDCGRTMNDKHSHLIRLGRSRDMTSEEGRRQFEVGLRMASPEGQACEMFGWIDLAGRTAKDLEDEELRLFHVALTRAKKHLIVSGVLPSDFEYKKESTAMINRLGCPDSEDEFKLVAGEVLEWEEPVTMSIGSVASIEIVPSLATEASAEHLTRTLPPLGGGGTDAFEVPPLNRPPNLSSPNVPLSFTALSEFAECPSHFYAKRILGLSEDDAGWTPSGDPESTPVVERDRATAFGSAVHELFEAIGKSKWRSPGRDQIEKALRKHRVDGSENVDRAQRMIEGFLRSDLGEQVAGFSCSIEVPLLARINGVTVRGFADLIVETDPPLVLDYKTNRLNGKRPAEKMADYAAQRDLYALALARARQLDAVRTAYVFLEEPDEPVDEVLYRSDLDAAAEGLSNAIEEIRLGRYFGGAGAVHQPCGECWACELLAGQIEAAGRSEQVGQGV